MPVRLRSDLEFIPVQRGDRVCHIVKDPVTLKYFEFDEHELALLKKLDGQTEWHELRRWFNRRFPPLHLTHHALQAIVWKLHQQGLLTSHTAGQGRRLAERARASARQDWLQTLSQPWAIRLPGINPAPWLGPVTRLFGWLFAPGFVIPAALCLMVVAWWAVTRADLLWRMGPSRAEFLSPDNVILLAVVIALTKVVHELGHAIAARRHGCECHDLGVLLLAGMPTLYCDVSDAWTLPRRWSRISVALAGIWVELLIAATAFLGWMASVPGVVHAVCFDVMLVCSLGTLAFNANPLVRYDGYFVLMDLANVPNLGQRANEALGTLFRRVMLGITDDRPLDATELPRWCVAYGLAAAVYRVFLTCAIVWGLHLALKPMGASPLLWLMVFAGVIMMGVQQARSLVRHIRQAHWAGTPTWRMTTGVVLMAGLTMALLCVPLPWYLFGEAVLEPADRQTIVAAVPGRSLEHQPAGTVVVAGALLARQENRETRQELAQLVHERQQQVRHLQMLQARRHQDRRAAQQIPGAHAAVESLASRIAHLQEEEQRLQLRSPAAGVVYAAPPRAANPDDRELSQWTGSVLDPLNHDVWLNAGDAVCQVGSIDQLEAIAILSQDDMEVVSIGQPADIYVRSIGQTLRGEVSGISQLEWDDAKDASLSSLLPAAAIDGPRSRVRTSKWYQIQIRCLEPAPPGTLIRSRGQVRILAGSRTLGTWLAQQFFRTFRWHA